MGRVVTHLCPSLNTELPVFAAMVHAAAKAVPAEGRGAQHSLPGRSRTLSPAWEDSPLARVLLKVLGHQCDTHSLQ